MGMAEVACQRVRKSGRRQRLIRDGQRAEATEVGESRKEGKKKNRKRKKPTHSTSVMVRLRFKRLPTASAPTSVMPVA